MFLPHVLFSQILVGGQLISRNVCKDSDFRKNILSQFEYKMKTCTLKIESYGSSSPAWKEKTINQCLDEICINTNQVN